MKTNKITMTSHTSKRKIWIGRWIVLVAIVHTIFAAVFFGKVFLTILQEGAYDSVGLDPMRAAAVWFLLFGAALALMGMAIHALESESDFTSARIIGAGTLVLAIIGIILMPDSGFWLVLPAAIGLLRMKPRNGS